MEARIHVITLAVGDLDRALRFYRDGLGLPTSGITGTTTKVANSPLQAMS